MQLDHPAVIVALLTPFDERGRPDSAALRAHVDMLIDAGIDGLMPCGTTGEAALLSDDELAGVVRATVAAADGRVPVLAHVGRPGTLPTLTLARQAVSDGAAAISAVVPYYYAVDDDGIRAHYATLAEGVDAPVYAYTIPEHTHRELEPELLEKLIADGIAGLKDSTKSIERHQRYAEVVRAADASFELYDGSGSLVLPALREGSAGAVLAVANVHPELSVALMRAFRQGDDGEAERLQDELAEVEGAFARDGMLPALKTKAAERLAARGIDYGTEVRSPVGAGGRVPA